MTAAVRTAWAGPAGLLAALLVLVVCAALAVVFSSHQSRQLFHQLEQLRRQAWSLDEDWERLLLEQSTWAAHERVRQLAERQLDMVVPDAASVTVIHERE